MKKRYTIIYPVVNAGKGLMGTDSIGVADLT